MAKKDFAFGKKNFILIAGAVLLIIIGFIMMSGGGSADSTFNPEIFSTRRIVVAPIITFIGYMAIVYGILKKSKDKDNTTTEE